MFYNNGHKSKYFEFVGPQTHSLNFKKLDFKKALAFSIS